MKDCVFCRIVARESHADVEYEDDAVLAFKDIYPKAPVHLLIVPKRHIDSVMTMVRQDAELLGRGLLAARTLREAKGCGARGDRLRANCGPAGGQHERPHHLHMLAGW